MAGRLQIGKVQEELAMWHWIRDHRRKQILEAAFPSAWEAILAANVPHYRRLDEPERHQLRDLVQIFVAEKRWEGCGGLVIDDAMRVTIAAEACLIILALPHDLYRNVQTILVYPSAVVIPERRPSIFEIPTAPIAGPVGIVGEAQLRGPVILVWDEVRRTARHPERGHNVVYHEFAHKLDMLSGQADGTPPLSGSDQYKEWAHVFDKAFVQLRADRLVGRRTVLDSYAATNEAEFFAVVTEQFFDRPAALLAFDSELYRALAGFYRQDPAARTI
jgi:Mlc titration factor MtfA (ptsG expression regulator)